ncbi:hypothetical protein [Streptomyces sp. CAS3]
MQAHVKVVRVLGLHDGSGGIEVAGACLVDPGVLELLDDVAVVGAAAPDGVGEEAECGGRSRGEHDQVLGAGDGGPLGGGLDVSDRDFPA